MNVHSTSRGLDPSRLAAGADVVVELDPAHGLNLPFGALAHDHLALDARFAVDALARDALAHWRAEYDEALSLDGLCLPEIWTFELYEAVNRCLVAGLGLRAAALTYEPRRLRLADAGRPVELAARAAGRAAGVPIVAPTRRPAPPAERAPPAAPARRRARGAAIRAASRWGVPSMLRRGSTLVLSYWPLAALLDRLLWDGGHRPAIALEKRPAGPDRSLRAAVRGGWLGLPSRRAVAFADARLRRALAALSAPPAIEVDGMDAGPLIHDALVRTLARGGPTLAAAGVVRHALGSGRVDCVAGTYELEPYARLVLWLARESGVRTFCLAHGAYLLPQPVSDLELADEVALWSPAIAPPLTRRDRPIHVVGYPGAHRAASAERPRDRERPRVAVLAQTTAPSTAAVDGRVVMRHYAEALAGVAACLRDATVVLRPHPSQHAPDLALLRRRFPAVEVVVDRASDIERCLSGADVAIGGASAATLQGAIAGTPVIVLNVTGYDWRWPLGGDTTVPVAHSAAEVAKWLERWSHDGSLPGADDLLDALGARGGDATERLIAALEGRPAEPVPLDRLDWPPHMRGAALTMERR